MDTFSDQLGRLASILTERKMTLSLAESCTGGLISEYITSLPGASAFFLGSVVTYSNESKTKILGVPADVIRKHGAVSSETAGHMAKGALNVFHSSIAASVTGIAGPSGGTPEKPVGTVFIAVRNADTIKVRKDLFIGSRDEIRLAAAHAAVTELLELLE